MKTDNVTMVFSEFKQFLDNKVVLFGFLHFSLHSDDNAEFDNHLRYTLAPANIETLENDLALFVDEVMPEYLNLLREQIAVFGREVPISSSEFSQKLRTYGITEKDALWERYAPRVWDNSSKLQKKYSLMQLACAKNGVSDRLTHYWYAAIFSIQGMSK